MIEFIVGEISNKLRIELNLDDEKYSIIKYGIFALIQILTSIFMVGLFGKLLGVFIESLLISFIGAILRKYSGGAHASTPFSCSIIGIIFTVLPAYKIKRGYYSIYWIIFYGVILYIVALIIIYKLAPVDSPNKRINKREKIKKLKKGSIIILTIYMVIVIFNILFYNITKNNIFLVYSSCIYIGTLWQVFTLTKLGHIIVKILDFTLIKISNILRGSKNEKIKQ